MSEAKVRPYQREGAWVSMHSFHYECAYRSLQSFRQVKKSIAKQEEALAHKVADIPEDLRQTYISHKTEALNEVADQAFVSSLLFACMAVEAFINHYGVKRLGERFFRKNLERLGITEKFSILVLACHGVMISKDDQTLLTLRAMFDTRNQLVHPKTREFSFKVLEEYARQEREKGERIEAHFSSMENVISGLCALDEQIHRDFEFQKPKNLDDGVGLYECRAEKP